ncbi:hypothetical protein BWI89_00005 [Escherichia coli]|nr:hypothetical protein BWI89_00005 [Escherichia coli]
MSDNNLRLQVILNAVDKLTRPFRAAQASSKELAGAIRNSRDALKQLNQAGARWLTVLRFAAQKSSRIAWKPSFFSIRDRKQSL